MAKKKRRRPHTHQTIGRPTKSQTSVNAWDTPQAMGLMVAAVILLGCLVYGNSLQNGFTMDDKVLIEDNYLIRSLDHLPTMFFTDYWAGRRDTTEVNQWQSGLYRPMVMASYAINYAIGGPSPLGFHAVNVLIHVGVTCLVYAVALSFGTGSLAAFVAAALFAVHPIHTEAVTGIVGRAELLMTFGLLASLWLARLGRHFLALGAFALALFSKEQAMIFPLVLLLSDVCSKRTDSNHELARPSGAILKRYGPYLGVLGGYLALRVTALETINLPTPTFVDNPLAHVDIQTRLFTAIKVAGWYLYLFIWPAALSADYSYNAIPLASSLIDPGALLGLLVWGMLIWLAIASFRHGKRAITFAIGLTTLTFIPVSNLIMPIGTIMGERLFYLPSAGLCWLAGMATLTLLPQRSWEASWNHLILPGSVGLLIMAALFVRTVHRNEDWKSNQTLFQSAARVVPNSAKVHAALGGLDNAQGAYDQALQHYKKAFEIYPAYPRTDVDINLGMGALFLKQGETAKAVEAFRRAVELDPRSSLTHYNLGLALARHGSKDEAEQNLLTALAFNPSLSEAYNTLSRLWIEQERYQEGLAAAETALRHNPNLNEARYNRAQALTALGRTSEAANEVRHAQKGIILPGFIGAPPPD